MAKPVLIDSHSHIYYEDYSEEFEDMLARAAEAGVKAMLVVGTDIESSRRSVELADKYPQLYAAVGIHPHDADGVTENDFMAVKELALSSPKVVAIGEIGLDFYRDRSPRSEQVRVFRSFLRIASELDLPVVIHDRDAHDEIIECLVQDGAGRGVLHCFSGDAEMAERAVSMGYYISVSGTVTYPSNGALREVVRSTGTDRLLVETDCPYLSPEPFRGRRNEPARALLVAARIAEIKGLDLDDVCRITTKNCHDLFGINVWDNSAKIAYRIRRSIYLNITNRCSNRCVFCAKFDDFTVKGHNLLLDQEPSFEEIMSVVANLEEDIDEFVFCGYGEPLVRLDIVKRVAAELKRRGFRVRINTDGQANLVHGRNVLPELEGLVDSVSVSLNAPDAESYLALSNTPFGAEGYVAVTRFISEAKLYIPSVVATAVTLPGVDIEGCRRVAEALGAEFRVRKYAEVG